jgi:hypothetical protein
MVAIVLYIIYIYIISKLMKVRMWLNEKRNEKNISWIRL